ncbi:unnamed protein product [Rotaria sp. Silwood2]|nr:unnamed protein product [Rotaria sp. Silwood2]
MGNQKSKTAAAIEPTGSTTTSTATVSRRRASRMVQNFLLVWLDANIDESKKEFKNALAQLRQTVVTVMTFTDADECIQFIMEVNDEKVFLIISGSLGQHIVPKIDALPQVDSIYIYCRNRSVHEQWAKTMSKVKGVHTEINSICKALQIDRRNCDQDMISISFNHIDPLFMYTQFLKEALLDIEDDDAKSIKELAEYCRLQDDASPKTIEMIEREYPLNRFVELRFDPVRREHHGNYTCLAKNLADITSTVANLFVEYKPVFMGPEKSVIFSVPNYRAIMKCQFDSYPPPTIQWVRMPRRIKDLDSGHILVQDNDPQVIDILTRQIGPTLYETQLTYNPLEQDFGLIFECRAINPRIGRYSMNLRRAEPPQQVRVVEVKPRSNSIQLNIQPPLEIGGLPLLEYLVNYEQIGVPHSLKTFTFPVTSNEPQSLLIESLQPSTLYRMQIMAKSRAGEGSPSIPYQLKTLDRQVPQFKILSSDISCLDDQSCLIKWIIESDGGSPISRTEISYAKVRGVNEVKQWSPAIQIEPLISEFELKELQSDTNYLIKVRLFNEAGVGEQTISKKTSQSRIDPRSILSDKRSNSRYPSKWVIIGTVSSIIIILAITIFAIIAIRSRFKSNQNHRNSSSSRSIPPSRRNNHTDQCNQGAETPLRDDGKQ